MQRWRTLLLLSLGLLIGAFGLSCGGDSRVLTIYAGRSQNLVQPLLEQFSKDTGIHIQVRYGDGTDLALGILEEGDNSPADVYYGQDVGSLGALRDEGRLQELPDSILEKVPPAFRSPDGVWVGISGRARVIVYNTDKINPATLPKSALDYTNPEWRGRVGFVPRSDGFPEFVTALRHVRGEEFARSWLTALRNNNARAYANNIAALTAVANGEIDVAYLNHYYLYRFLKEQGEGFKARNYYFENGDLGGLFVVSGAAVLDTAKNKADAERFIEYLLSPAAQKYFTDNTYEYPMVSGVPPGANLPPLNTLKAPEIDLSDLSDLKGSLDLMRAAGVLP
jgi:iron(III) transport system substrate-binding protein